MWQIADLEREGPIDVDAAAAAMDAYAEAGFTTFDMADHYGSAEDIAGVCATRRPGDLQLLTKWTPEPGAHPRATVREAVGRSLDRLRADAIDLLQFHAWRYPDPSWLDCLFALQELKDEGLIRHLGLTNFDAVHLDMVVNTGIEVVSNQVSFSLLDGRASGAMTEVCRKHGVHLLAYGTLAGGLLTERWLGAEDPGPEGLKTWSEMKYHRFVEAAGGWERLQALLAAIRSVAEKHGVSMANVAARAVLDRPAVAGRHHRGPAGAERAHRRHPAPRLAPTRRRGPGTTRGGQRRARTYPRRLRRRVPPAALSDGGGRPQPPRGGGRSVPVSGP